MKLDQTAELDEIHIKYLEYKQSAMALLPVLFTMVARPTARTDGSLPFLLFFMKLLSSSRPYDGSSVRY